MTESQAQALVATILAAYPKADWPEETRAVYRLALVPFDFDETRIAIEQIVATEEWPPSVAELRRSIVENRLDLPSDVVAWEMASAHASARRPGAPRAVCIACAEIGTGPGGEGRCPVCDGAGELDELDLDRLPPVPDPIPAAARSVGGWTRIRESERPEILRRDFVDAYRRLRAEMVERENLRMLGANGDHPLVEAAARGAIEA